MKTRVYITVDVESSMGGAWANRTLRPVPPSRRIFCNIDGESHGIGWLTREFGARGMKATFFCEVFSAKVFGEAATRQWFDHLLEAGQDLQLHTHLNYHFYAQYLATGEMPVNRTDNLAQAPLPLMRELSEEAVALFQKYAGTRPLVYRAGSWICSATLLGEMARLGIVLDSSFNPVRQSAGSFNEEGLLPNTLQKVGDVWELPVTVVKQAFPERSLLGKVRHIDPTSMSFAEMRSALQQAHAAQMPHVCLVLHSFSGVKPADDQYRSLRPDHVVRGRLAKILDFLSSESNFFSVVPLVNLAGEVAALERKVEGNVFVPDVGFIKPLAKKLVQGFNRII